MSTQRILHHNGVINVLSNNNYEYQFFIKDHLGNTRVVCKPAFNGNGTLKDKPTELQRTDYYPFGMIHGGREAQPLAENENRYLYNGKEYQARKWDNYGYTFYSSLHWYDYGVRFYDAQLGRWHSVDPLAEKYYDWSPYNYVAGNPIKYIDPDGKLIVINGGMDFVKTVVADIQRLTDYGVSYTKTKSGGYKIELDENLSNNATKPRGNSLISNLANPNNGVVFVGASQDGEHHTIIKGENVLKAVNGEGADYVNVQYNPENRTEIENNDGTKGASPHIFLAHELLHSENAIGGVKDDTMVEVTDSEGNKVKTERENVNVYNDENIIRNEQNEKPRKAPVDNL